MSGRVTAVDIETVSAAVRAPLPPEGLAPLTIRRLIRVTTNATDLPMMEEAFPKGRSETPRGRHQRRIGSVLSFRRGRPKMVVLEPDPPPRVIDEYFRWSDDAYIPEVLAIDGFVYAWPWQRDGADALISVSRTPPSSTPPDQTLKAALQSGRIMPSPVALNPIHRQSCDRRASTAIPTPIQSRCGEQPKGARHSDDN